MLCPLDGARGVTCCNMALSAHVHTCPHSRLVSATGLAVYEHPFLENAEGTYKKQSFRGIT